MMSFSRFQGEILWWWYF